MAIHATLRGTGVEHRIRLLTGCTDGPPLVPYPSDIAHLLAVICSATLGGPEHGYRSIVNHLNRTTTDEAVRRQRRELASVLYAELSTRYVAVYPNLPVGVPYTGTVPAIGITKTAQIETLAFNLHDAGPQMDHAPYWSAVLDVYASGVATTTGVRPTIGRVLYRSGGILTIPCDGLLSAMADLLVAQGIADVRRRGPWCPACPIGCRAVVERPTRR